ncbi:hypothetical protein C5167_026410 [Papaver somniferum]|uniref:probable metal-nicotianamine transporter YSL7 n=1 Tax=Papaver somniferum TaxID=3469 RepID=UPI000E6F66D8|nr:probable metal-nicotianamine transporter YSL7 [Papaver somniferum]RZC85738.1 hypothetical protein C5167_026410 [Papaver somniferum]
MEMETEEKLERLEDGKKAGEKELTVEEIFESQEVPSWRSQLTIRSIFVSAALGFMFTFIVTKLNITTGVIPSLNVAAGLLGFFFIKLWTSVCEKFGWPHQPFNRQENTVIQTCVVAVSGIAFSSGYASYMLGMTKIIADQGPASANTANNVVTLNLGMMYGFLALISFVGLFSILSLRKIMIIDYKLIYPSGTATAYLINSFHTDKGAKLANKQIKTLSKWLAGSFVWAFFQWFFTSDNGCGFTAFPTFGPQAFARKFYFDFSSTYVGVGMITPYSINLSMLLGSIVSWGLMWPLIELHEGKWYPANLPPNNLSGIQGYRVFIAIAMILGDGLFQFIFVLCKSVYNLRKSKDKDVGGEPVVSYDDKRRTEYFLKDQIPVWVAVGGYITLAILSTICVPLLIFPSLKWYHIMIIYIVAPILAFCNSYGCGLTDWSLASTYGKLAIFVFGAWVGLDNGGIIAALAACGVMMSIVSTASDLMQDFKTGYLTLASPRSMFFSQVIGTMIGVALSPVVFWGFFYKAYPDLGKDGASNPAPFGALYRGIALLATQGLSALPKNCLKLCIGFFFFAILVNIIKQVMMHFKNKALKYLPSPIAMAVPFYLGGYYAIDMCIGSLYRYWRERNNKAEADAFVPAIASGLICGDSLWGMPASALSLMNAKPPMCMKFLSRDTNTKVDAFLNG